MMMVESEHHEWGSRWSSRDSWGQRGKIEEEMKVVQHGVKQTIEIVGPPCVS